MPEDSLKTAGTGEGPSTQEEPDWTGTMFGNYRIVRALGRGGMGQVLLGEDVRLNRKVAVKVLPAGYTTDAERLKRFSQEARAASALSHPHIVSIFDIGEAEAGKYIVMEYVEGRTLRDLSGTAVEIGKVTEWGEQMARALAAAHASGIVHRDIKPENVMVRHDGYVKVLDFGLARLSRIGQSLWSAETAVQTSEGQLLGTMRYMSPEQGRGETVTPATDVFSLGIVLYELATKTHPFTSQAQVSVLHAIIAQEPIPPSRLNAEIPAWMEDLILRMLAKAPAARPTAEEVVRELAAGARGEAGSERQSTGATRLLVGREAERSALRTAVDAAEREGGAMICIAGEAGIGKTALVEDFLAELSRTGERWIIGRGRCSERLAAAEAYLPFLEALESLLRQDSGGPAARAMMLLAPTWYRHAARQTGEAEAERAVSQERMKREMVAFLQELSRQQPMVLFFDDLHWADASTVDMLAYIGGQFRSTGLNSMRLAIVVTYRPTEMQLARHPFLAVKPDLVGRGVCRDLPVDYLSVDNVDRYLDLLFPTHAFPADFARLIHAKTEGNALFMTDLIRYLKDRRLIQQTETGWVIIGALPDLEMDLPESVRSMVQRKIDQLEEEDRKLLTAASIQGFEFDSASVSAVLKADPADVEEQLDRLERVHAFVRLIEECELPDRTFTLRYRFIHVLYQNAFYASLRPTRKAQLSLSMAESLLGFHREHSVEIASNLAFLFETGRDFARAAHYFILAARNASQVFANKEAAALAQRGLDLLRTLPSSPERNQTELMAQMILGVASTSLRGFSAPEVETAYGRAYELCQHMAESEFVFQALNGLRAVYLIRADYRQALELTERLVQIAEHLHDDTLAVQTLFALAFTKVFVGDLIGACELEEKAISRYNLDFQRTDAVRFGVDPKSIGLSTMAWAKWALGFPDTALDLNRQAREAVKELRHPLSTACVLSWQSTLEKDLEQFEQAERTAELTKTYSAEHGLVQTQAWGMCTHGSVIARMGEYQAGLEEMRSALNLMRGIGSRLGESAFLLDIAECLGEAGHPDQGLSVIAETRTFIDRTGERHRKPDIDRIEARLLLKVTSDSDRADQLFLSAIENARSLHARTLELRAALELADLRRSRGRIHEAREVLQPVYESVTEGLNTPLLQKTRGLLDLLNVGLKPATT
jgi:tetratricopeptide (TPR) repeat protein